MSGQPRESSLGVATSRREFLASCVALASAGCGTLGGRMRSAYIFADDPTAGAYRPVFQGLIRALLPFEDSAFPLSPEQVERQLLDLFHFETDERYLRLQQTLLFFNDLDLFSFPLAMVEAERVARDVDERGLDERRVLAAAREIDARLGEAFAARVSPARRFTALDTVSQRAYLALWAQSGFLVKRRFLSAAKALIMISAYSQDDLWPAIGYDGPLVASTRFS